MVISRISQETVVKYRLKAHISGNRIPGAENKIPGQIPELILRCCQVRHNREPPGRDLNPPVVLAEPWQGISTPTIPIRSQNLSDLNSCFFIANE